MDFWMLAGRVIRRWYLALPLLLLGVVVASSVASSVRPSYAIETQVLLAPSGTPEQAIANPLLLSNRGQLDAATQSVAFVVESPEGAEERAAAAPGADVSFSLVQEAPIVVIEVSAPVGRARPAGGGRRRRPGRCRAHRHRGPLRGRRGIADRRGAAGRPHRAAAVG